jgi:hypothetical protein
VAFIKLHPIKPTIYEETNLETMGVSYFKNVFKPIPYRTTQKKKTVRNKPSNAYRNELLCMPSAGELGKLKIERTTVANSEQQLSSAKMVVCAV